MQGQPDYTANIIFGYDDFATEQQVTLLLNQNGKTVADRGIQGAADVILEPRLDVQLVYRWDVSEALSVRAKVNNLLNEEFEYSQEARSSSSTNEEQVSKSVSTGNCRAAPKRRKPFPLGVNVDE